MKSEKRKVNSELSGSKNRPLIFFVKPNTTLTVKGTQSVQTTDNFEVKVGGKFIIK